MQSSFVGPIRCGDTGNTLLLCKECDADHPLVVKAVGEDEKERDCVCEWLTGVQLSDDRATAFCWDTDPFPAEDFPEVRQSERRFFHYRTIAKKLGAVGNQRRAKLPPCVAKRIAQKYADPDGEATKVGYHQGSGA